MNVRWRLKHRAATAVGSGFGLLGWSLGLFRAVVVGVSVRVSWVGGHGQHA